MNAAGPVLQSLAVRIAATRKSVQEIKDERARLAAERESASRERVVSEKAFLRTWDRAISEAELALPPAESRVRARLATEVNNTNLLKVGALSKDLPRLFSQVVEDEVSKILTPMETTLGEACRKLQTDYPTIQILPDHPGRAATGGKHDSTFTKGVIGGGALFAVGVGGATAASAAIAATTAITTVSVTSPIVLNWQPSIRVANPDAILRN